MMASLRNLTQNKALLSELKVASSLKDRTIGAIGLKAFQPEQGLWIQRCNWIHTFFMSIPIDVVYLDKSMVVKKVQHDVKPWKLPLPVFGSRSVIELASGRLSELNIQLGDQLNVGD